ncbi:hypothetical protein HZA96_03720 [Candidatus Woesearchaeota archaeon]|nr:hypothetical protein [Candidatus Woesearchaeota archaeon]
MKKVLRDTPLMEITLRRYERPDKSNPRELVKKFCLSIGLLQPGDSRDIIVDILYVLLRAKQEKKLMDSEQVKDAVIALRKEFNLQLLGVASSNVRRQIKRLRDVLLVEKIKNDYRIIEFSHLSEIYQQKFEQLLLPTIVSRIKEYMKEVDAVFG